MQRKYLNAKQLIMIGFCANLAWQLSWSVLVTICTGLHGSLPGVTAPGVGGPSLQAQLFHLEQHYHLQKEMLNRQFEEDQRLLEHEKQQYKMQVLMSDSSLSLSKADVRI